MEESIITLAPGVTAHVDSLRFHFARSGGPGGQNVNKVNSKAELRISLADLRGITERAMARLRASAANRITSEDDLLVVADTERHQEANRKACIARLSAIVAGAVHEPKPRRKTRPSRSSVTRRLDSKRAHSRKKQERSGGYE